MTLSLRLYWYGCCPYHQSIVDTHTAAGTFYDDDDYYCYYYYYYYYHHYYNYYCDLMAAWPQARAPPLDDVPLQTSDRAVGFKVLKRLGASWVGLRCRAAMQGVANASVYTHLTWGLLYTNRAYRACGSTHSSLVASPLILQVSKQTLGPREMLSRNPQPDSP